MNLMDTTEPDELQSPEAGTKKLLVLAKPPGDMTEQELDTFADTVFAGLHTQVQEQQASRS
jgi:hypothetical protein